MTPTNRGPGSGGGRLPAPTVGIRGGSGVLGFRAPAAPDRTSAVFAALSDPTRRALVEALGREGEATATALSAAFPVTRQAIVKHLAALAEAGLVSGERVGREHRYHLQPSAMDPALAWMAGVGAAWDERLAALKRHLARRP
jgi:DNA-binding transcriptional ArsR family regulator